MCSRMDKPKAVTAAAHKLARLIYTLLTKGEEYIDQGQDYYEDATANGFYPSAPRSSAWARRHRTTGTRLKSSFTISHLRRVS